MQDHWMQDEPGTPRADVLVSLIRDAVEERRLEDTVDLATTLARTAPAAAAWCSWVVAGCHGLAGRPGDAVNVLTTAAEAGAWWAPALLSDDSLTEVWNQPDGARLRARLGHSYEQVAPGEPRRYWVGAGGSRTVVALHGNGPLPAEVAQALWSQVADCRVLLVRSSVLLAPEVAVWLDRDTAVGEVMAAVDEARAETVASRPLILVGLGAGGAVAAEVAATHPELVDGAVAVAAPQPRRLTTGVPALSTHFRAVGSVALVVGDAGEDTAAVNVYRRWAAEHGVQLAVHTLPGLGHAFPLSFGPVMTGVLDALLMPGGPAEPLTAGSVPMPSGRFGGDIV